MEPFLSIFLWYVYVVRALALLVSFRAYLLEINIKASIGKTADMKRIRTWDNRGVSRCIHGFLSVSQSVSLKSTATVYFSILNINHNVRFTHRPKIPVG